MTFLLRPQWGFPMFYAATFSLIVVPQPMSFLGPTYISFDKSTLAVDMIWYMTMLISTVVILAIIQTMLRNRLATHTGSFIKHWRFVIDCKIDRWLRFGLRIFGAWTLTVAIIILYRGGLSIKISNHPPNWAQPILMQAMNIECLLAIFAGLGFMIWPRWGFVFFFTGAMWGGFLGIPLMPLSSIMNISTGDAYERILFSCLVNICFLLLIGILQCLLLWIEEYEALVASQ